MSYTFTFVLLLHLIYLLYLSNVYCTCSFFTNLDLFCIDNARVIYQKVRYLVQRFSGKDRTHPQMSA